MKVLFQQSSFQCKRRTKAFVAYVSVANWKEDSRQLVLAAPTAQRLAKEWESLWPSSPFDKGRVQKVKIVMISKPKKFAKVSA